MRNASTSRGGIVVAVDGTEQGYAAVRYAAREARRLSLPLDVIHVFPASVPVGWTSRIPAELFSSYGAELLERAREIAVEAVESSDVQTHLWAGERVPLLAAFAEHARLLVLGSRSPHSFDRIWTGGTVTGVSSTACCPVVVVPAEPEPFAVHHRIVAGYKSPAHAGELFDAAFRLAEELASELVVLHAWRLPGVYDDIVADRVDRERWCREQAELIGNELADYREAFPDVQVRVYVRHEDPAHALVRTTRGADRLLLVRPAHGRLVHHLGRTARAVLREAHCPVEVLPPRPRDQQPSVPLVVERSGELVP
jgi:nucleotide-binding universal stress UspA family protein